MYTNPISKKSLHETQTNLIHKKILYFLRVHKSRSILIDRDHDVMGLYLHPHSNSDSHTIPIHFRCVVASSLILLVYCVLLSDAFVIVTGRSAGRYVCIYSKLYYIYNTHVAAWLALDI